MNKEEIYLYLKNFLVEEFKKDPVLIEPQNGLMDTGMDSLDAFDFFTMINEKYEIDIDHKEIMTLKTMQDVVDYIDNNTKK